MDGRVPWEVSAKRLFGSRQPRFFRRKALGFFLEPGPVFLDARLIRIDGGSGRCYLTRRPVFRRVWAGEHNHDNHDQRNPAQDARLRVSRQKTPDARTMIQDLRDLERLALWGSSIGLI